MSLTSEASSKSAEQAYADLLPRIKDLRDMDSENLEGAMKDLKGALLANPAAATLMLPIDIGEMVDALRRLTGQSISVASKEKSTGVKRAKKVLSAEEMNAAFEEL